MAVIQFVDASLDYGCGLVEALQRGIAVRMSDPMTEIAIGKRSQRIVDGLTRDGLIEPAGEWWRLVGDEAGDEISSGR